MPFGNKPVRLAYKQRDDGNSCGRTQRALVVRHADLQLSLGPRSGSSRVEFHEKPELACKHVFALVEIAAERPVAEREWHFAGPIISVGGAPGTAIEAEEEDEQDDMLRPLPDRLVTELTTHRTLALCEAVATSPRVAFAAVFHAFVLDTFYTYAAENSCMQVSVRGAGLGVHAPGLNDSMSAKAINQRHEGWSERLPDAPADLWETLIAFDADEQAMLFAHCAAFGVNAVWEPANRYNEGRVSARSVAGRIAHSHILARAANLDTVAAGWTATIGNYLGRVTNQSALENAFTAPESVLESGRLSARQGSRMATFNPRRG